MNTIEAVLPGAEDMGQRKAASENDILKINLLYKCAQTTTQAPQEQNPYCTDKKDECGYWSRNGLCQNYADYMAENCPVSCGTCATCWDKRSPLACESMREMGYCASNAAFMLEYCTATCEMCDQAEAARVVSTDPASTETDGETTDAVSLSLEQKFGAAPCRDYNERKCVSLKERGLCTSGGAQVGTVQSKCKKTCGLC